MKTRKLGVATTLLFALAQSLALGQQPVITSFQGNGQLTWSNAPGTNGFTVQWAPTATGPWCGNWQALDSLVVTGAQSTAVVPMFYRIAQGFSAASMRGSWIMSGGPQGTVYYVAQEDGTLSEIGDFNQGHPVGYFTVSDSGRVTNTVVYLYDGAQKFSGTFADANLITLDGTYRNCIFRRLEDASRCAGNWTGTLSQTSGPDLPTSHPVSFTVNSRGLVGNFTGFSGVTIGRMFALTNGVACGFFVTGTWNDNGAYNQVRISGTLTGNAFSGSYWTDGSDAGTVSLTRQ